MRIAVILFVIFLGGRALADEEQAVIAHFNYGSTDLTRLFETADRLKTAIEEAEVGEYDGHEIAVDGSDGTFYMYGPSADRLAEVVLPVLESTKFMAGAVVKVRYGPPAEGVDERLIRIGD